jgi:hypothetical protein
MAATSTPYGLLPLGGKLGSRPDNHGVTTFRLIGDNSVAIYLGDLVNSAAGVLNAIGTTPTTTRNGNTPLGVMLGAEFTDPVTKTRIFSQHLPVNAHTAYNAYGQIVVHICDDPDQLFKVQADGAVTAASIGKNAALTNFGQGSATTGKSKVQLQSSSINTTNTLAVRIVDLVNNMALTPAGSAPGDAYTDCVVCFNQGVHAYRNATGG